MTLIGDVVTVEQGFSRQIPGIRDFRRIGNWLYYSTDCDSWRERRECRNSVNFAPRFILYVFPGSTCQLSDDNLVLSLPTGAFRPSEPITHVVQSLSGFVAMTHRDLKPYNNMIGFDETGSVRWKLYDEFVNLSPVRNTNEVLIHTLTTGRRVDVLTGAVIEEFIDIS